MEDEMTAEELATLEAELKSNGYVGIEAWETKALLAEVARLKAENVYQRDTLRLIACNSDCSFARRLANQALAPATPALHEAERCRRDEQAARETNRILTDQAERYRAALERIAAFSPYANEVMEAIVLAREALAADSEVAK